MANARALDRRRRSVRNIRKITRTMELIATARFKKAMDRSVAARDYTQQLAKILKNIAAVGEDLSHPLLESRPTQRSAVLVLTGNRGLCGGYNSNAVKQAMGLLSQWSRSDTETHVTVSGKRGINALKFRGITIDEEHLHFEDKPAFNEVSPIGTSCLNAYIQDDIDRLDVVSTRFVNIAKQEAIVETLLPLQPAVDEENAAPHSGNLASEEYDFYPSAESILEEIIPASFQSRLFKCFLDSAVSEQVARMVAMKGATENASGIISDLSRRYNRARQTQITGEIMEILGGVEALKQ